MNSRDTKPTFKELQRSKPHTSSGAPARVRSHYDAILTLLRQRGSQGVLGSELYSRPDLYGRSPRNRISELRRDGHLIEGRPLGSADWHYQLIRDNAGAKPLSDSPDWYEREHGPRPSLLPRKSASGEMCVADPDCFVLTAPEPRP